jgi:hypothetical protein
MAFSVDESKSTSEHVEFRGVGALTSIYRPEEDPGAAALSDSDGW